MARKRLNIGPDQYNGHGAAVLSAATLIRYGEILDACRLDDYWVGRCDGMIIWDIDESEFATAVASALDRYVNNGGPGALTPHPRRQAYRHLARTACYDILKQLTKSAILVLELKVTRDLRKLESFDEVQHRVIGALFDEGVPIHYAYNLVDDYNDVNSPEYTLEKSNVSEPDQLFYIGSRYLAIDYHHSLRYYVDKLLNGSGAPAAIAPLFGSGVLTRQRQLDASMLLLAYNVEEKKLMLLDRRELQAIRNAMRRYMTFPKDADITQWSREQIRSHLSMAATQIQKEIDRFINNRRPRFGI